MNPKVSRVQLPLFFMLIVAVSWLMPQQSKAQTLVTSGLVRQYESGTAVYQNTGKTTAATANGQFVADWGDQSPSALDATQATAGSQPTFQTNQFGSQPGILFTHGSNNGLNSPYLPGAAYTVVSVQKVLSSNTSGANFPILSNVTPGFGSGFDFSVNNGTYHFAHSGNTEGAGGTVSSATTVTTISGSSTTNQVLRVNGIVVGLSAGSTYTPASGGNFSLAYDPNGSSNSCNEVIGAVLVYNRVLSAAEESQDEQYLSNKYSGSVAGGGLAIGTTSVGITPGSTTAVVGIGGGVSGGTPPYNYVIQRALAPGGTPGTYTSIANAQQPFGMVDALAPITQYAYQVSVTDSASTPATVVTAPVLTTTSFALPPLSSYVLCCFKNTTSNQEDEQLWTLTGPDGVNFTPLNNDTYAPQYSDTAGGSVRDPQITYTNGAYYAVYTEGSYNAASYFAVAKSTNLVDWHLISRVNVAADSGTTGNVVWRPTWFIDNDGSYHVFVFTGNDSTPTFRLFRYDPAVTTGAAAFVSWSSGAETVINQSSGTRYTATIDPCLIHPAGGLYTLLYKDESTKYVCRATSSTLAGPYVIDRTGNWTGWGTGHEGPSPLKTATGWRVYSDAYGPPSTGLFYSDSTDLNTWTALSPVVVPGSWGVTRNGSVIQIANFATVPKIIPIRQPSRSR